MLLLTDGMIDRK